jgi:hypothetical protein
MTMAGCLHKLADLSTLKVGFNHLAADGLTTNIPDLQCHVLVIRKLKPFHEKVKADGLVVVVLELILAIAADEGRLS